MMVNTITPEQWEVINKHVSQAPVRISGLAQDLGIPVKLATLAPGISGEIRPDAEAPSGYKIRVNRHEAKNRQRFTVAHEIAHYLLHRNLIGQGVEDSVLYRSKLSNSVESQANGLAANLLMPKELVMAEVEKYPEHDDEALVETLSISFEVSPAAMRIRLGVE